MLLSYSASVHLGIVEFKIPNEAKANAMVSSVTNTRLNKKVSFKDPLCSSTPAEVISTMPAPKKSILKWKTTENKPFQDNHNTLQNHNTTDDDTAQIYTEIQPFQDHPVQIPQKNTKKHSFQDHSSKVKHCFTNKHVSQDPVAKYSKIQSSQDPATQSSKKQLLQDHTTKSSKKQSFQDHTTKSSKKQSFQDHNVNVKDVQDIISLKSAFPQSFDTTGNMPGVYTIHLDPSVPQVQHAHDKVPIECREAIEKLLQDTVNQEIIAPVTEPKEWVSSLTYPQKARWFPLYLFRPKGI